MLEKRTPLQPDKISRYELKNKFYQLSAFFDKENKTGVFVFLHETDKDYNLTINSKKLLKIFFNNKNNYIDFLQKIENHFLNFKNTREILLDIEKENYDNIWLNPNFVFKDNASNKNRFNNQEQNGYVDVSNISIYSLLEENSSGQSILSDMGLVSEFSSFNPSGNEIKIKINTIPNNKKLHFSLAPDRNFFSDWTKGANSFNGYGALNFFIKAFDLTKKDATSILFKIYLKNKDKDLIQTKDFFKFRNSFTMPLANKNENNNQKIVQYISHNRAISSEIVQYMIQSNVISYANMIRTPIDTRLKSKIKKGDKEIDINVPKQGIHSDLFYFNLFDQNDNIKSIQYISLDPRFKKKLNAGSTTGVYSGIKNIHAKQYVLSEAAFDNIALFEIAKRKKINTDNYNFFSCQSVGGVLTWIESNFNVSFNEDDNGNLKILKNNNSIEISDFNDSFIESFKKEIFGNQKENATPRKFVFVYNDEDELNKSKFKIIASSLKKIDKEIQIDWIENKNRYYKFFDFLPLDIVIDSSSVDNWLERNNFTIANGTLQNIQLKTEHTSISNDDILNFKNTHNIDAIISACDNDSAGHMVSKKIKLFCETFNIKFADWSPEHFFIKDHNDALKIYKGQKIEFTDDNGVSSFYDLSNVSKKEIFNYVDEAKINYISNKKKINKNIL